MVQTIVSLLVVVFFVLVNAFFSGTEMAVISLNDTKMRKLAEDGDKNAKRMLVFLDNPGTFLATIQVGVTIAGFLSSAFAASSFAGKLALLVDPTGTKTWAEPLFTVLITIVLSYFSLVFGELVPKRIAQNKPEKWAYAAYGLVRFFGIVTKPFVKLLTASTNGILRLCKIDPNDNDKEVTEEEIRMMVDVGSESGNIEDTEREMIDNVFEFNDKEVSEVMTHRKKIIALPDDATYKEAVRVASEERYSRIPVYNGTIDDIVGILHIKDLLGVSEETYDLSELMRDPLIVHESRKISSLFEQMKKGGLQMAVIVDEYGGTMGICTIEDMLEELVGSITDEFDDEERQNLIKLSNGDLIVSGDTTLSDLEGLLDIEFEEDEYDTIAGLVIQNLDRVPEEREKPIVTYKNLSIKVLHVEDRWISKVLIHKLPEETEEDKPGSDKEQAD
ncbi:MAG: HlyC/CorC family transporter [Clostridiales bacterium]|nr:HlyC/CorC family transporter [Clostridiales bacterium]